MEALAREAVSGAVGHSRALAKTLVHAARAVTGPVFDPTGVDDLASDRTGARRPACVTTPAAAARRAVEAWRLEEGGQYTAAIEICHDLIGDPFPVTEAQSAADALHALAAGGITSTGRAVTSPRGQRPARPHSSGEVR